MSHSSCSTGGSCRKCTTGRSLHLPTEVLLTTILREGVRCTHILERTNRRSLINHEVSSRTIGVSHALCQLSTSELDIPATKTFPSRIRSRHRIRRRIRSSKEPPINRRQAFLGSCHSLACSTRFSRFSFYHTNESHIANRCHRQNRIRNLIHRPRFNHRNTNRWILRKPFRNRKSSSTASEHDIVESLVNTECAGEA